MRGMVGYGVECNIDHSGSDSTINAFALQVNTKFVFYTGYHIVRFEARVRDITRNTAQGQSLKWENLSWINISSSIVIVATINGMNTITIDNAATKVKCDKILKHVESSKTSLYGPANKYQRMHVLLGAQSLGNSTQCRMNGLFKNFEAYHVEFESVSIPEVWCDAT